MVSECGTSEQSVKFVYGVDVERLSCRNGVYLCGNKEHVEMSTANQKQNFIRNNFSNLPKFCKVS